MSDDINNGYQIIQVSALGRHPVRKLRGTITGGLYARYGDAEFEAQKLNDLSEGERYEIEWYIGIPRK